jgi:hypothetical protein
VRCYGSDLEHEEDAGYVADSSSSSSDCGDDLDGEDRPLLRREVSFERYRYGYDPAKASVETVILATSEEAGSGGNDVWGIPDERARNNILDESQ